eukprot:CAMPEP_0175177866 /NCGR_PEP_ID=MMETSP0087-20121206/34628_1 /TAXON_ID=136419 /ORGANISM="Unknown Unknown, Strain D1" /LENGTH=129 /DNA_ID=CAMNT_0016469899 /DNA_START=3740 /DNA_END=4129 /DNA_ORIENTATION=-
MRVGREVGHLVGGLVGTITLLENVPETTLGLPPEVTVLVTDPPLEKVVVVVVVVLVNPDVTEFGFEPVQDPTPVLPMTPPLVLALMRFMPMLDIPVRGKVAPTPGYLKGSNGSDPLRVDNIAASSALKG